MPFALPDPGSPPERSIHTMFVLVASGIVFVAGLGTRSGEPQAGTLSQAVAVFSAADLNRDGKLSAEETRSIPVSAETFASEDADGDGFWSRDEFLVSYRKQLVGARRAVAADLDAEVTRILALKRVEALDPSKKPRCETSARSTDAGYVNQRFEATLSEVEAKCAARRASREDFQRLRNLVVLNGRAASRGSGSPSLSTQGAMLAAIDRIERRAALGQDARDDFHALREACTAQAPLRPAKPGAPNPQEPSKPEVAPATETSKAPPTSPRSSAPPSSSTPAPASSPPAGPAASRQRAAPPPAPKPQPPPPRPAPQRPATDPPDRSKP